jgi:L-seryl-tRNA(Ser) seleniumtransferase
MPASRTARPSLRTIPQLGALLERPAARAASDRHGRTIVSGILREGLEEVRAGLRSGALKPAAVAARVEALLDALEREAAARTASTIRPVVNATGVILHTNLGRAVLAEPAARRMLEVARACTTLEYDLARGARGSRSVHLDRVLRLLFPGRGFHVVNNNAAAVLLALNTLAEGREVVVSRGELVEIGGSFRIPDIMRKSGALLKEVGTTNRTRLADYERALGPRTGLLLKVHPSNYRIVGFVAGASLADVAALGKRRGVPVLLDQGSGNLLDLRPYGIADEPSVSEALAAGADVVAFSGDKLLGGPQAGLLVGRPDLIRAMRDNPVSRAVRVDKATAAALEATLVEHARGRATETIPALRMLALGRAAIGERARRLRDRVAERAGPGLTIELREGVSVLGGGSAPAGGLPTVLLAVCSQGEGARRLEERLRSHATPVIARIEAGRVLLDLRTVLEEQEPDVEEALVAAAGAAGAGGPAPRGAP